jgi:putative oxidoreductase
MSTNAKYLEFAGRAMLVLLFLVFGFGKTSAYAGTAAYMASAGVPAQLLPLVIAFEIGASVAIIVGWRTRLVALLLAGFTLLSAVLFHNHLGDKTQQIMFMKNVAIAGGLLLLVANGAGPLSLDARRR